MCPGISGYGTGGDRHSVNNNMPISVWAGSANSLDGYSK